MEAYALPIRPPHTVGAECEVARFKPPLLPLYREQSGGRDSWLILGRVWCDLAVFLVEGPTVTIRLW